MRYDATITDGTIRGIMCSSNANGGNITEAQYNQYMQMRESKPTAPDGYRYYLNEEMTEWVLVEIPVVVESDDDEISDEEALSIIYGGAE